MYLRYVIFLIFYTILWSCHKTTITSNLYIKSEEPGTYEIYKFVGKNPTRLQAKELGNFNQKVAIEPGLYLIGTDCSWAKVEIVHKKDLHLSTDLVEFELPLNKESELLKNQIYFGVQCARDIDSFRFHQSFKDKFRFNFLKGEYEILAGLQPLRIVAGDGGAVHKYSLAALSVEGDIPDRGDRYYVRPLSQQLAIVQSQSIDNYLLLLPGDYRIEMNGTTQEVSLKTNESISLPTVKLRIDANVKSDFMKSQSIKINNDGTLLFNEEYLVLRGKNKISFLGSKIQYDIDIQEAKNHVVEAFNITVQSECSLWELSCLGRKKIYLYEPEQHYPFAEGKADIALFYLKQDVLVSVVGAQDIKYRIPRHSKKYQLRLGKLSISPTPNYKRNLRTDLVRLEASDYNLKGNSVDLNHLTASELDLIEGNYVLAVYNYNNETRTRSRQAFPISIRQGKPANVNISTYVSQNELDRLSNNITKQRSAGSHGLRQRTTEVR